MVPDAPRGRFEELYDDAPCGLLAMGRDGRILSVNRTISRWLGYSPGELVGKRMTDILSIGSKVYWETHVGPLLSMERSVEGVALDFLARDNAKVEAFGSANGGKAGETRIAIFKASERRQFEQALVSARQVAERANIASTEEGRVANESLQAERATSELREQFIAVLGHDLRNPLAGLVGGVRLLGREDLSERARKLVPLMMGSAARMSELIDNVMDFAKARLGGGIVLDRNGDAPLGPTLRQVVDELKTINPTREIILEIAVDEPVDCDRARIAQLVSNLLGNALTHGAADLPIRLRASTTPEELEITVTNGGDPIPAAAMEKLFQPFFRGEIRASQQGLGLGLHIASEIAKAHGGTIVASSSPDETRFTFRMPLAA